MDPRALLAVAARAADAAADAHREGRGRVDPSAWSEKGRSDFVTEVDVEAERRIVGIIRAEFPDHAFLAEEGTSGTPQSQGESAELGPVGATATSPPVRWIIDPLDGTTNWLHGYPEYAVSIAAEDADGLLAGLVLNSATGERFEASRGDGARLDGQPISVSAVADLKHALVGTGFPFKKLEVMPAYLTTFERVLRNTSGIRRAGAAALDLCDLACGRLDAFFEYWLMPWDVAAGALILRESEGVFERLEVPGLAETELMAGATDADAVVASASLSELRPGGFLAVNRALAPAFRSLIRKTG